MKTRLLLGAVAALAMFEPAHALAEVQPTTQLSAAATCEGAFTGTGRLEVTPSETDPTTSVAALVDEAGVAHPIYGFGISGETLILIDGQEPITRGIEMGAPLEADGPATECFVQDLTSETRILTQADVAHYALDPPLVGVEATIETVNTGVVWPAQ